MPWSVIYFLTLTYFYKYLIYRIIKHSRQPRLLFEKRESPVRFQSNVKRGGVVGDGVVGDGVVGDGVVGNGVVFWAK